LTFLNNSSNIWFAQSVILDPGPKTNLTPAL